MDAGDVERHLLVGIGGRGARDGEYSRATLAPQLLGEVRLRLDEDPVPAELLQVPSLRPKPWVVGADVDIEPMARMAKKFLLHQVFGLVRENSGHSWKLTG